MKFEIMSGRLTHKGNDILYHVRCRYCRTVRIITKKEIEIDKCSCDKKEE